MARCSSMTLSRRRICRCWVRLQSFAERERECRIHESLPLLSMQVCVCVVWWFVDEIDRARAELESYWARLANLFVDSKMLECVLRVLVGRCFLLEYRLRKKNVGACHPCWTLVCISLKLLSHTPFSFFVASCSLSSFLSHAALSLFLTVARCALISSLSLAALSLFPLSLAALSFLTVIRCALSFPWLQSLHNGHEERVQATQEGCNSSRLFFSCTAFSLDKTNSRCCFEGANDKPATKCGKKVRNAIIMKQNSRLFVRARVK